MRRLIRDIEGELLPLRLDPGLSWLGSLGTRLHHARRYGSVGRRPARCGNPCAGGWMLLVIEAFVGMRTPGPSVPPPPGVPPGSDALVAPGDIVTGIPSDLSRRGLGAPYRVI